MQDTLGRLLAESKRYGMYNHIEWRWFMVRLRAEHRNKGNKEAE